MSAVPVEKFGKDHWSTFAYIETCCVDNKGQLDKSKMRTNIQKHPLLAGFSNGHIQWTPSHNTRLKGFFQFEGKYDPEQAIKNGFMVDDHDDWDCLDDLEAAGFVESISLANGVVKMTELGMKVASLLRVHKVNGGHFAQFSYPVNTKHTEQELLTHV